MRKKITLLILLAIMLVGFINPGEKLSFKESIQLFKNEAENNLSPYKFDGTIVTYFYFKTYQQKKEVEIYFFNQTEYRLSFNGKCLPHDIEVNIYDKKRSENDRVLLKRFKNISGKNIIINSNEFYKNLTIEKRECNQFKRVYIDYDIPSIPEANNLTPETNERAAVVLAVGYK
jgi:hypothetical protein